MGVTNSVRMISERALGRLRHVRGVPRIEGLARREADRVRRRLGRPSPTERAHWHGTSSLGLAARTLATRATELAAAEASGWVLTVGGGGPLHARVDAELASLRTPARSASLAEALALSAADATGLACVVCAEPDAPGAFEIARALLAHDVLGPIPLEFVSGLEPERDVLRDRDEYRDTFFMSPALLAHPSPYDIYEESLQRFEQKCGLRDYLDLYQVLVSLEEGGVIGPVAEFGSYKGHSGWLIARTLQALGSDREVFLFDTFDAFPSEEAGVDYFWSSTHEVSFEEVAGRLAELPNVHLVRGDFTATLPAADLGPVALAYVDCDSYRAVSFLARQFDDLVSPGGWMLFEDYGHPALLGCRVAVHEHFDGRADCVRFLSQFSGVYLVAKR